MTRFFKRGHIIRQEDVSRLRDLGKENIAALDLGPGWVHEDRVNNGPLYFMPIEDNSNKPQKIRGHQGLRYPPSAQQDYRLSNLIQIEMRSFDQRGSVLRQSYFPTRPIARQLSSASLK